jgi:putative Mg2+ transporter-C (MgtC) family protein
MWQEIWITVLSEFSDTPDATQITRITLRLLVAAALGGLLGYEREKQGKSAGVRTHMLVAIGAALFVLIPQQAGASTADLTRVLQGLVAGVGFLGHNLGNQTSGDSWVDYGGRHMGNGSNRRGCRNGAGIDCRP